MANRQIRRTGEHGRSLATAGLILGYISLAPLIFLLALMVPGVLFDTRSKIVFAVIVIGALIDLILMRRYRRGPSGP